MTTPVDDEHVSGSGAPLAELERDDDRAGAHARRLEIPAIDPPRHPLAERPRYFLSSLEPSGDYDAVIVTVSDGERRRYFTTRDGAQLTEVDEESFERRRESGVRSLLELDERELGELEVELRFVRPVRGRDPIAEAAESAADAATREEAEPEPVPAASEAAEAPADPTNEDDDAEVDPVTEEFEEMVMESTMMTSEGMEGSGIRRSGYVPAVEPEPALLPIPSAESMSATDAIAQVSLAKGISFIAHRGRLDKSGAPYIDHPGRISERFDPVTEPIEAAAAWLHDVLEDTAVTAQELLEAGLIPEIVEVVEVLTRTPEVSLDEYYARIRRDRIARRVKLADIDDNTARWRLRRLEYETQLRLVEKYRYARQALGAD
ncbi:hypothetical protein [Agromyces albus]|uniref:HD domain-containing protein n=1 Tax=Agromyces albus TaxID=205332 RepID=A0A4Q2KS83_9MICO|nr:hypothetical protein [Agromyces albus]RXZ68315.1 hypothetical protein ESP51_14195 [Agromyces albus]